MQDNGPNYSTENENCQSGERQRLTKKKNIIPIQANHAVSLNWNKSISNSIYDNCVTQLHCTVCALAWSMPRNLRKVNVFYILFSCWFSYLMLQWHASFFLRLIEVDLRQTVRARVRERPVWWVSSLNASKFNFNFNWMNECKAWFSFGVNATLYGWLASIWIDTPTELKSFHLWPIEELKEIFIQNFYCFFTENMIATYLWSIPLLIIVVYAGLPFCSFCRSFNVKWMMILCSETTTMSVRGRGPMRIIE